MNKPIIFTGPYASGKTYISFLILKINQSKSNLRIDCCGKTTVGIIKEIPIDGSNEIRLIVFDECINLKKIKAICKSVKLKRKVLHLIFCTQSHINIHEKGFDIVNLPVSH